MENQLIPAQEIGGEMDAVSSTSFETKVAATAFYQLVKERLVAVNQWHLVADSEATSFELLDFLGVNRGELIEGNYIKIDIPGPGTRLGEGFDWVRIEKVEAATHLEEQYFGFRVRPCANPRHYRKDKVVAHFFEETATCTFIVRLKGNTVFAAVHGRNEEPNTTTTTFFDGLRNRAVGYSAKVGFSYPQWQLLVNGLVKVEEQVGKPI